MKRITFSLVNMSAVTQLDAARYLAECRGARVAGWWRNGVTGRRGGRWSAAAAAAAAAAVAVAAVVVVLVVVIVVVPNVLRAVYRLCQYVVE